MKNAARLTALCLLVVASLAGCFKAQVDLTLNSDDTVSGTMVIAVQSGLGAELGAGSDDEILDQLTGGVADELGDATVEDYVERDDEGEITFVGKEYAFSDLPLDSFSSGEGGEDISITRDGDTFIVDGTWNTEESTEGIDPATLGASFTFAVTFPGHVTDHNGVLSDDGHTVTWDLFSGPDVLHAEGGATEGSSNGMVWVLIGGVALLIAAAVVITAVTVRKRGAQPE